MSRWQSMAWFDGISKGWPAILAGLKTLLETGTALTIPPAALAIEGFQ